MWEKGAKVKQRKTGRLGTVKRRGMQRVIVVFVGGGERLCHISSLDRLPSDTCMNLVRYKRTQHVAGS